jgi:hypothetical protein
MGLQNLRLIDIDSILKPMDYRTRISSGVGIYGINKETKTTPSMSKDFTCVSSQILKKTFKKENKLHSFPRVYQKVSNDKRKELVRLV